MNIMETVETNDTKGWIIGAVVLVAVIAGGWWLIKHSKATSSVVGSDTSSSTTETSGTVGDNMPIDMAVTANTTMTTTASGETVSAKDQPAASSVMIASMSLTKASWIAVKDAKGILGAGWFPAGATAGAVPLLRATKAGESYQAVIYVDDGDKQFDMRKDSFVMGADGSPVAVSFMAK